MKKKIKTENICETFSKSSFALFNLPHLTKTWTTGVRKAMRFTIVHGNTRPYYGKTRYLTKSKNCSDINVRTD